MKEIKKVTFSEYDTMGCPYCRGYDARIPWADEEHKHALVLCLECEKPYYVADVEFLALRLMGQDSVPCFICGRINNGLNDNIAAYAQNNNAAIRIREMFVHGSDIYVVSRAGRPQMKIGACKKHLSILETLAELLGGKGVISKFLIEEVIKGKSAEEIMHDLRKRN